MRCDAVKPSCGFCTNKGIECTYQDPTFTDRFVKLSFRSDFRKTPFMSCAKIISVY